MTMLSANGITAVIGNWVRARGIGVIDGVDYQSAGVVESVRVESVREMLEDGVVPIFPASAGARWESPTTSPPTSWPWWWPRRWARRSSSSSRLVTASRRSPSRSRDGAGGPRGRLANFSLADLDAFFAANPGREIDLELLHRARRACAGGVERVHILDGREEGVILKETFSNLGSGTMVYSNRYGGIRPMTLNDISDVLRIMRPFVEQRHPPAAHRGAA